MGLTAEEENRENSNETTVYSRLGPREVASSAAHTSQTLSLEHRLHVYPSDSCYRWSFLPPG